MRKQQKKIIENLIELLLGVNEEIKKSIEAGDLFQAMDLMGSCQEGAIKIGTAIEESEGEGFITVQLLEQYCEDLYHFYEELNRGQAENISKTVKKLKKQLIQTENSIKHDIKETIEVVFLPYKASMWDSLESVWQAAEKDENCQAYVIPIPYYDRNPDGSFKEMHYEGELYPDYVPITHYEEYDLEEHHPDMIYIHNPYDGQNLVTSVHPAFYSEQLKRYTDCLVYIPYFVLGEISPDNQDAVNGMKHFCMAPGVVNADKVVVQSESMRQVYINVLTGQTGEHTRHYWEDKILGLGSPKFDKVQAANRKEQDIPEEWLGAIQKPDGSWKKVILYNTSVGALLQENERIVEKMREVFQTFKEYQENITLLWRPHPLAKATIEAMRPELWKSYVQLVQEYKEAGWGIYDDTADLNRAIALSEAYYGDWSSVVQLCQKAGVKVMIQNIS